MVVGDARAARRPDRWRVGAASRAARWHRLGIGAAGVAGLAAALLSNSYLLAGPLGSRLSPADSFVSELAVPGQPTSGPLRLTDVVCGLLTMVLAAGLAYRRRPQRWIVAGALLLAVSGLATVADAADPMPCTPSTSLACRRELDRLSPATVLHHGHVLSSTVVMTAMVLAMLVLARARVPGRPSWAGAAAGVLVAALNLAELPLIARGGHGVGVVERLLLTVTAAWIAVVSVDLLRDARRRGPHGAGRIVRQRRGAGLGAVTRVRPGR